MVLRGAFILKYSHTLLTTPRSKPHYLRVVQADRYSRVLLATIQDKGICPCPQCLIPKSNFYQVGFLSDISARLSHIHTHFQQKVLNAQQAIYKLGKPLKGMAVILKAYLLVPTVVSAWSFIFHKGTHGWSEHLYRASIANWFQHLPIPCGWYTYCISLIWESWSCACSTYSELSTGLTLLVSIPSIKGLSRMLFGHQTNIF